MSARDIVMPSLMLVALVVLVCTGGALTGCAPECTSLHDCPTNASCSVDGRCVATDASDVFGSGLASVVGAAGATTAPDVAAPPDGLMSVEPTSVRMTGRVGRQLNVDSDADQAIADSWGISARAPGDGADAIFVVNILDEARWEDILRTPGTYRFNGSDVNAPFAGVTCTTNETGAIVHYDEMSSSVEVVVRPPDSAGEVQLDVTQVSSGGSD